MGEAFGFVLGGGSGGGGGGASLTHTFIGVGNSSNLLSGSSALVWNDTFNYFSITSTNESQLILWYDIDNFTEIGVDSLGDLTIGLSGTNPSGMTLTVAGDLAVNSSIITASTIAYIDANKKFHSLANAAGVLTNDGAGALSWAAAPTASVKLNELLAADATNTINNATFAQEWQWNTLAGATGFTLSSTSTAAASNLQKLFAISLSGVNATSAQTTYAGYIENLHTGTTSTNVGLYVSASGGATANYGLIVAAGSVGIGTVTPTRVFDVVGNSQFVSTTNNTTTNAGFVITNNSLTTGSAMYVSSSSLTSGSLAVLELTGATGITNQTVLNIATSGANNGAAQRTYGLQVSNTHTGGTSYNVAGYFTATGATNNYAIIVPSGGGNVGIHTTLPTAKLHVVGNSSGTSLKVTVSTDPLADMVVFDASGAAHNQCAVKVITSSAGNPDTDAGIIVQSTHANHNPFLVRNSALTTFFTVKAGGNVSVGSNTATVKFNVLATTEQMRILYDASNYYSTTVGSTGIVTFDAVGAGSSFVFSNPITVSSSVLTSGSLASLTVTGTGALTGQKALNIDVSGANGTGAQTTYGLYSTNTHTGTSVNVAGYFSASGGSSNYGLLVPSGRVGFGNSAPAVVLDVTGDSRISGSLVTGWASASPPNTYQTTNGNASGANLIVRSSNVADSYGYAFDNANKLGFNITVANASGSAVTRGAINIASTVNTAGAEKGDLTFLTQNAGAGLVERMRIAWDGAISASNSQLTSGSLASFTITGTGALTGQKALNIDVSGANGTGAQTTYGLYSTNTHTGTSVNVAGYFSASGGSSNYGLIVAAGSSGFGNTAPTKTVDITGTFGVSGASTLAAATFAGNVAINGSGGNPLLSVGNNATSNANYYFTNGGGSTSSNTLFALGTVNTTGDRAIILGSKVSTGILFSAVNSGAKHLVRASINTTSLVDTAGSEKGNLSFYTQNAGAGLVEWFTIGWDGLITQYYDPSNYYTSTVSSTGAVTWDATGTGASFTFAKKVIFQSTARLFGYTVATLPAGVLGDTAYVTDANAPAWGAVVAGGGAVTVPVFYDGVNWIFG
jgi:hypothetical protein